jgi:4-amino-4-deoxy-L-arabinose transferase-like glycosyltransferase
VSVPAPRLGRLGATVFTATALLYALVAAPVPFHDKGEPREALVARAILEGHGVVLPRRDGREIPSKPPLFHWLAALAAGAGVRPAELAMRLPSVVLGAATVAGTAVATAAVDGTAAGVLAAVVLGSGFEFLHAATTSRVDMTLAFFVALAALAWHLGRVRLGWVAGALAVLAKGPVGLVLPLGITGADALVARDPRRLRRLADAGGVGLGLAIAAGWYAAAWWSGGAAFVDRQLLHENVARALGGRAASHAHPFWYYGPALLGSFMPWTLALPAAAVEAWRGRREADRFAVVWVLAVFGFYSLASGKRSVYLLPLLPPLAMLTASGLVAWLRTPRGPRWRRALAVGAGLLVATAVLVAFGIERPIGDLLAPLLKGRDRANLPVVIAMVGERRLGIALALAALAAGLAALRAGGERGGVAALAGIGVVWTLALGLAGAGPLARATTPRAFATEVRAVVGPGDAVCSSVGVDYALRWYLDRPLPHCGRRLVPPGGRGFVVRAAHSRDLVRECPTIRVRDARRLGRSRLELAECDVAEVP